MAAMWFWLFSFGASLVWLAAFAYRSRAPRSQASPVRDWRGFWPQALLAGLSILVLADLAGSLLARFGFWGAAFSVVLASGAAACWLFQMDGKPKRNLSSLSPAAGYVAFFLALFVAGWCGHRFYESAAPKN